jgi:flagellar biogenesis protein FliO
MRPEFLFPFLLGICFALTLISFLIWCVQHLRIVP